MGAPGSHHTNSYQASPVKIAPGEQGAGLLFITATKCSTIVDERKNKYAFCLIHDHQQNDDNCANFCYSDLDGDDVHQIFDFDFGTDLRVDRTLKTMGVSKAPGSSTEIGSS
jgi:hypothetical protein